MSNQRTTLKPNGFTVVEILVALLVLSVGLLGFAGILVSGTNNNQEAFLQDQAMNIAKDLASRMHANREYINWDTRAKVRDDLAPALTNEELAADVYSPVVDDLAQDYTCPNTAGSPDNGVDGKDDDLPPQPAEDATDPRTEIQIAQRDVWLACFQARKQLPEGRVRVVCNDIAPRSPIQNPYHNAGIKHRVFSNTAPTANTILNDSGYPGSPVDNEVATETCSPGSSYTIMVHWIPMGARSGGNEETDESVGSNYAPRCHDKDNFPNLYLDPDVLLDAKRRTCMTMDVTP